MVLGGLFDGKSSSTDTEGSSLCPRQTAWWDHPPTGRNSRSLNCEEGLQPRQQSH
jgi:hypothetical protein